MQALKSHAKRPTKRSNERKQNRASTLTSPRVQSQQLIVAERKVVGRVRWTPWQRFKMVNAARLTPAWQTVSFLVQPATILRWHRAGFRLF
jgi:putative transposase